MPLTHGTPLPNGIATGPDGNVWWADPSNASSTVGKMTMDDTATAFATEVIDGFPTGIVAGPDGAMWFTYGQGGQFGSLGRITTSGSASYFSFPTSNAQAHGITLGADGNLWFAEFNGNTIGRMTTAGDVTEFALAGGSQPTGITAGPDGAL